MRGQFLLVLLFIIAIVLLSVVDAKKHKKAKKMKVHSNLVRPVQRADANEKKCTKNGKECIKGCMFLIFSSSTQIFFN
jgi:hypothetical protein